MFPNCKESRQSGAGFRPIPVNHCKIHRQPARTRLRVAAAALLAILVTTGGTAPAAAQGTPKVGDQIGDWVFQCQALSASETRCALVQNIVDKNTRNRVIGAVLRRVGPDGDKVGLFIAAPLGIYLGAGIAAKIDQGEQFSLQLQSCTVKSGCIAGIEVDAGRLEALRKGKRLLVGFKTTAGAKTVTVPVSLKGVTDGLKALGRR